MLNQPLCKKGKMGKGFSIWVSENGEAERRLLTVCDASKAAVTIGRSSQMDCQIGGNDKTLSRHQFDLIWRFGSLLLLNRGRTAQVDGRTFGKGKREAVHDGMVCEVGQHVSIRFDAWSGRRPGGALALVVQDRRGTRTVPLSKERVRLGKDSGGNDVVLDARGVSRWHAELLCSPGEANPYRLRDVGSTNGMRLAGANGQTVHPGGEIALDMGQNVRLGAAQIQLVDGSSTKSSSRRRLYILIGAGLAVVLVFSKLGGRTTSNSWACVDTIARAVTNEHVLARAALIQDCAAGVGAAKQCATCWDQVTTYKQTANELAELARYWQDAENACCLDLPAYVGQSVWLFDSKSFRKRQEYVDKARQTLNVFNRTLQEIMSHCSATSQTFEMDVAELKSTVRDLPPFKAGKTHPTFKWPPLVRGYEIKAVMLPNYSNALQKIVAAENIIPRLREFSTDGNVSCIQSEPFVADLQRLLDMDAIKILQQIEVYGQTLKSRRQDWERVVENWELALSGEGGDPMVPKPWRTPGSLPETLRGLLERASAKDDYERLASLGISNPMPPSTNICGRISWCKRFRNHWPKGKHPIEIASLFNASDKYLQDRRSDWEEARARVDKLAGLINQALMGWEQLDHTSKVKRCGELANTLVAQSQVDDLERLAWQFDGDETQKALDNSRTAIQKAWTDLSLRFSRDLYRAVQPDTGRQVAKADIQQLATIVDKLVETEGRFKQTGVILPGEIASFTALRDRLTEHLRGWQE